jgi:hypothetical protein
MKEGSYKLFLIIRRNIDAVFKFHVARKRAGAGGRNNLRYAGGDMPCQSTTYFMALHLLGVAVTKSTHSVFLSPFLSRRAYQTDRQTGGRRASSSKPKSPMHGPVALAWCVRRNRAAAKGSQIRGTYKVSKESGRDKDFSTSQSVRSSNQTCSLSLSLPISLSLSLSLFLSLSLSLSLSLHAK